MRYLCGEITDENDIALDHILPLSKGESDNISSFKLVHRKCKMRKADKTMFGV